MSDPVTKLEIEDVLSSIRKLVSADHGPAEDDAEAQPVEPDRLVLTPALRVNDHDMQDDEPQDTQEAAPVDTAPTDQADQAEVDDEEYHEARDEDVTPHESSDHPDSDETDSVEVTVDDTEPEHDSLSAQEEQNPQPEIDADHATDAGHAAIFQQVADTPDDEWEPDDSPQDPEDASLSDDALQWQDTTTEPVKADDDSSDEGEMERLDPVTSEAGTLEEYPPETDPDPRMPRERPEPDNAFLSGEGMFAEDDAILDEEALRDLVAEIVRQELQGSLGERITRNVRKLVRREIQRALAAQELDC